ncbi:MAG: response regulator [Leptospiraceae bacterium]|nr:response regulator [Leptospiraceae bacterium]
MNNPTKILIVEDEVINAMFIKLQLVKNEFQVCNCVTTGEEAIESSISDMPDVILMDIGLASDMDGVTAAEHIQSKQDIPIIFLSAFKTEAIQERTSQIKPGIFLDKPVDISKLITVLKLLK